jgi:ubiquinone/menaquinone biosynthesis C-methylase UbiE
MKPRDPNRPKKRHPPTPKLPRPLREPGKQFAAPSPPTQPPPTHWSDVADWYDQLVGEEGSDYHRHVVLPGALRLLGVSEKAHGTSSAGPAEEKILDIACGQGVLCRMLARHGIQATGIDAAPNLIRLAKDRNAQLTPPPTPSPPLPTYHVADARDLSFLPESHFSAAACLLAIQNMNPTNPVFASVARVLKPMGRFVIVMMHPAFRNPKETHWGWDDKQKVQYRRVDKYLLPRKIPIVTHPGKSHDYTWTFHKPIESYVKAARSAGLLIDTLEEWPSHKTSTSGPRAGAENTARKEIPMFLALRALKVPQDLPPAVATTEVTSDAPPAE